MLKKILIKILLKLLKEESAVKVNAVYIANTSVEDWLIWVESVLNIDKDNKFKLITNKDWFGFQVLKDLIYKKLTE